MYNDKDDTSRTILAVLMIPILQRELNQFRQDWNSHRIRAQKINRPCLIPDLMHSCPEKFGTVMFGMEPDEERLKFIETKHNYLETMKYIENSVFDCIDNILRKNGLHPVSFANMIEAYKLIYEGCRRNKILLSLAE